MIKIRLALSHRHRRRVLAGLLALSAAFLLAPPALSIETGLTSKAPSDAPAPATRDDAPRAENPGRAGSPAAEDPSAAAAEAATAPAVKPPEAAPDRPAGAGEPSAARAGSGRPRSEKPRLVVVLPLQSEAFARASDAVRRGFLAAATAAGALETVSVVAYADGGLEGALEAARFADPDWIVGPLTREDVNLLVRLSEPLPPVLALNQPDDPALLPAQVLTFALGVEGEARQAAVRLKADMAGSVAVLVGGGSLQRRLASAFEAEWARLGGTLAGRYAIGADAAAARRLREDIRKANADAVFLALDAGEAQRVRPVLGLTRIYATSQVYEGQDSSLLRDLDGVRFFGMPWVVQPQALVVASYSRDDSGSAALERLYAFGIDAWRLLGALRDATNPESVSVDGVTGRIALIGPRQFGRDGVLTEIRNGQLVPLVAE